MLTSFGNDNAEAAKMDATLVERVPRAGSESIAVLARFQVRFTNNTDVDVTQRFGCRLAFLL